LVSIDDIATAAEKDSIVFVRSVPKHGAPYCINTGMNVLRINTDEAFAYLMATSYTEKAENGLGIKNQTTQRCRNTLNHC